MKSLSVNKLRNALAVFCMAFVFAAASFSSVAQIPARPEPAYAVNDLVGIFTSSQKNEMENLLVKFSEKTSNRIVVAVVGDLEGMEPSQFAYELGEKWGVGSEGFDNGIVILFKPKTDSGRGQVFIAVGYGLEGVVPDAVAKRIVETEMIPYFKENDYYGGVMAALKVLMPIVSGEITYDEWAGDDDGMGVIAIIIIIFIVLLIISAGRKGKNNGKNLGGGGSNRKMSALDGFLLGSMMGRGGSGLGGGGSFGGGGFRGGFGGGHFGGGGAGGSW